MTRVTCVQFAPVIGDLAGNAARAQSEIDRAIEAGAQVVLLPELVTSGYMFNDTAEAAAVAIGRDDPVLQGWREAARRGRAVVAGGFCERGEDGLIYNSAVVFDGSGGGIESDATESDAIEPAVAVRSDAAAARNLEPTAAFYRKLHLWDREQLVFKAGDKFPPVIDTAFGRLAIVICYDLEFPELTRALALAGTQLLLVPTNWPLVERPASERPPEVQIAIAAARVNRMAIACADRCGTERGQAWTQGTTIVSPDGWVLAEQATGQVAITAEIDLAAALNKQLTEYAHVLNDRRPEFYGAVVEPRPAHAG